jgi:hypothetical protein
MPQNIISTPVNVTGASASTSTLIASIQIPSAGKWDVTYFVKMTGTPGHAALYNIQGVTPYANTEISGTKGTGITESSALGRVTITTKGAQRLDLRGWGSYQAVSGPTGRTGLNADLLGTGQQGAPGKDGANGKQGNNGINGKDGKDGAKGDKGDQGAPGPKGDAGANGVNGAPGARGETGPAGPGRPVRIENRAPTAADGAIGDIWYQVS